MLPLLCDPGRNKLNSLSVSQVDSRQLAAHLLHKDPEIDSSFWEREGKKGLDPVQQEHWVTSY